MDRGWRFYQPAVAKLSSSTAKREFQAIDRQMTRMHALARSPPNFSTSDSLLKVAASGTLFPAITSVSAEPQAMEATQPLT